MALLKKSGTPAATESAPKLSASAAREAEAQRKRARTLAKQQQAAERIAAATEQLSSGINEAASAAEELKRAADQIATGDRNAQRLRQALRTPALEARFDLAVVDTPPSLDNLLLNALVAADRVIVPYVPHPLSYDGVRQLARVLFRVMTGPNRALKILGFVPNVSADHIRQHRQVTGDVGHQFGHERLLPAIRNDIRLAEAFAAGQPIQRYAPRTRGAEDFAALAAEVLRRLG